MKTNINIKSFLLAVIIGIGLPVSAQALEDSKVNFTKDMHVNITTVTGNYFNAYDAIMNKPLAQLVVVNNFSSYRSHSVKPANSVFAMAMQVQDKIQYFVAVVDGIFNDEDKGTVEQECRTTRLAKLFF
ncbi:hypothetical protein RI844_00150 [Thalassotalea fonticola]|uniref:DUF4426 domain-containing protein n=1 Tax=Thalassotalea fonticola TaxID=3065649 RepID=A0ABZ0GP72_9GAMM|nr:hypothetical protein RI844_00150 [Colwelliaceae bacterium S1-1]